MFIVFLTMDRPTFTTLEAAYQLHFYLYFKTYCSRPLFAEPSTREVLSSVTNDVCQREGYHLLEANISADHIRLLISLKPDHTVSRAVNMLKGNLSRELGLRFPAKASAGEWLGKGYFSRSSGKADVEAVRLYVSRQVSHHGYRGKWTEGLEFANPNFKTPAFEFGHSLSTLAYHVVLVTAGRAPVFDETIAPGLFDYVVAVGGKRGFALERMTVLPDHIHFLLEGLPSRSIGELVLALANNTAYWMGKHYWGVLRQTGAWDVWQPFYYAGTVGEYTTAEIRNFLKVEEGAVG